MREFFNLVNIICSKFRSSITCLTVFSSSTVPSTSLSTSLADRGSGESSSTWSTVSATKSYPHEFLSFYNVHQLHWQPLCLLHLRIKVQERVLQLCQHYLQQVQILLNFLLIINYTFNLFIYCIHGSRFRRVFFNLVNAFCSKFRYS